MSLMLNCGGYKTPDVPCFLVYFDLKIGSDGPSLIASRVDFTPEERRDWYQQGIELVGSVEVEGEIVKVTIEDKPYG